MHFCLNITKLGTALTHQQNAYQMCGQLVVSSIMCGKDTLAGRQVGRYLLVLSPNWVHSRLDEWFENYAWNRHRQMILAQADREGTSWPCMGTQEINKRIITTMCYLNWPCQHFDQLIPIVYYVQHKSANIIIVGPSSLACEQMY